jgi:Protein of unknown function (DUF2510)
MSTDGGSGGVAPAGWYEDPRDPSQQRYWDGERWTEHVSAAAARASAGWYPDPDVQNQLRYWDGNRWTANVAAMTAPARAAPKAGWYPDPQDATQQRYWDGAQYGGVRRTPVLDDDLKRSSPSGYTTRKPVHVLLTEDRLCLDDACVDLSEIAHVNYHVTQVSGGTLSGTRMLYFGAATHSQKAEVLLWSHRRHRSSREERAYQLLVGTLHRLVEPRIGRTILERIQAGDAVQVGTLTVSLTGVADARGRHHVSWPDLATMNTTHGVWEIYRHEPDGSIKLAFKSPSAGQDAPLAQAVVETCAAHLRG